MLGNFWRGHPQFLKQLRSLEDRQKKKTRKLYITSTKTFSERINFRFCKTIIMFFKSLVRLTFSSIIIIIFFFPIYFWILVSLKKDKDIYALHPKLFNFQIDLSSYEKMFGFSRFFKDISSINFIGNDIFQIPRFVDTLIVSLGSTILVIIISVISAYSLSRMKIKFKEYFLLLIISTRIIPPISIAIPLYLMYKNLLILEQLVL